MVQGERPFPAAKRLPRDHLVLAVGIDPDQAALLPYRFREGTRVPCQPHSHIQHRFARLRGKYVQNRRVKDRQVTGGFVTHRNSRKCRFSSWRSPCFHLAFLEASDLDTKVTQFSPLLGRNSPRFYLNKKCIQLKTESLINTRKAMHASEFRAYNIFDTSYNIGRIRCLIQLLSTIFGLALSNSPIAAQVVTPAEPALTLEISVAAWEPQKNDRFLVDTKENMGYLIHEDGHFARFMVATGRNEKVHYLGKSYVATTPTGKWVVKARNTSPDRITFGKEGRFLRLYKDGTDYTSYGIHDYAYLEEILEQGTEGRFFSMGCVLVRKPILNLLEKIYELNGGALEVATVYGLDATLIAQK
jgi:hypothetical protein